MSNIVESGDSESEELFSSPSEDESPTKPLTYVEYVNLPEKDVQKKREVVLQTSDSSNSEEENEV